MSLSPATLWIYQRERFPLARTVPLLAVFSSASINLSALLAERPLPGIVSYLLAFVIALCLFFQMRIADEFKDAAIDRRYRAERPVPRGLISLGELALLGAVSALLTLAAAWHGAVLALLAIVWCWLVAMSAEFGAPAWLKARPVVYLVSHMAIMPLIDLLLTGIEWYPHGAAASGLLIFLALSYANGVVLEIGRKIRAPDDEREGVETWSGLWGAERAIRIWLGSVGVALILLLVLAGIMAGRLDSPVAGLAMAIVGCGAALLVRRRAAQFVASPSDDTATAIDTAAGYWVFTCYLLAGWLPALWRSFTS